jgi:hypothetical protein
MPPIETLFTLEDHTAWKIKNVIGNSIGAMLFLSVL